MRKQSLAITVAAVAGLAGCGLPDITDRTTFEVQPAQAEINPDNDGSPWDPDNSPPDVRLSIQCGGGSSTLTAESESYTPQWNTGGCSATSKHLMENGFTFFLEDVDPLVSQNITPVITVRPRSHELDQGLLTLPGQAKLKSITFRLISK